MKTKHTPGPWQVEVARRPHRRGFHIETRIFTNYDDPQLKAPYPVVTGSVGIGPTGSPNPIHFVRINERDASLIADAPAMVLCLELIRLGEARIEGGFEFCFRGIRYCMLRDPYPWTAIVDSIGWDQARKATEVSSK